MKIKLLLSLLFFSTFINAQETKFDYSKTGAMRYEKYFGNNQLPEVLAFEKNVNELKNFLLEESEILKNKKGFDLRIQLVGKRWDNKTAEWTLKPTQSYQYGMNGELRFIFEMFVKNGNKWTVEPPNWSIFINDPEVGGHGGFYNDGDENSFLKQIFLVFPLSKEIAHGIRYYNCEAQTCGSIVIFNPDRPHYWIPVKVREVTNAKLQFYNNEKGRDVYNFLKPIVDAMSEEELNADAYYGSDDAILNVNGKEQGLQLMRFNPDYWNKSLPQSAVQFITIYYNELGFNCKSNDCWENSREEFYRNNGHIEFWQEIPRQISWEKLAKLIDK